MSEFSARCRDLGVEDSHLKGPIDAERVHTNSYNVGPPSDVNVG